MNIAISKMRQCSNKFFLHRYPSIITLPIRYLVTLLWPLNALRLSIKFTGLCGKTVRELTNKSLVKQFLEQYLIAVKYFISPRYYYSYGFFKPENKTHIPHYLLTHPCDLFACLNNFQSTELINNKHKFTAFCIDKGLSVVSVLEIFDQDRLKTRNDPKQDIIVKPVSASKGDGFMLWEYQGNGFYHSPGKVAIQWPQLIKQVESLSKTRQLLLQPRIFNHSQIADLSDKALITARIVTFKKLSGEIAYLAAVLQIPLADRLTNNRGLVSPIDQITGELGNGFLLKPITIEFKEHPDTGGIIAGKKLPFWQETVDLALKAHTEMDTFISLGWDIAISNNGPILLEANICWDINIIQRPHQMPLGKTEFSEMTLARLLANKDS